MRRPAAICSVLACACVLIAELAGGAAAGGATRYDGLVVRAVMLPVATNPDPCASSSTISRHLIMKLRSPTTIRPSSGGWKATADDTEGHQAMTGAQMVAYGGIIRVVDAAGNRDFVGFTRPLLPSGQPDCSPASGVASPAGIAYPISYSLAFDPVRGSGCAAYTPVGDKIVMTVELGGCDPASLPAPVVNAAPVMSRPVVQRTRDIVRFTVPVCDTDSSGRGARFDVLWNPASALRTYTFKVPVTELKGCHRYSFSHRFPRAGGPYEMDLRFFDADLVGSQRHVVFR